MSTIEIVQYNHLQMCSQNLRDISTCTISFKENSFKTLDVITSSHFKESSAGPWLRPPHHGLLTAGPCHHRPLYRIQSTRKREKTHFKSAQCSLPSGALLTAQRAVCLDRRKGLNLPSLPDHLTLSVLVPARTCSLKRKTVREGEEREKTMRKPVQWLRTQAL